MKSELRFLLPPCLRSLPQQPDDGRWLLGLPLALPALEVRPVVRQVHDRARFPGLRQHPQSIADDGSLLPGHSGVYCYGGSWFLNDAANYLLAGVHGLPADSLDTFRGRIRALTAEDTARAARDLVHPERAAIVLVGPAEAILPQLQDLGAVEVVQP